MKATLLKSVVLVTLVFAGVLNANLSAQDKFVYNDEVQGELVISKTIYINEDGLQRHLKYDYSYDEQGRIAQKEAFKWNNSKEAWVPSYKLSYTFSADGMVMELAKWNNREQVYSQPIQRNVYTLNDENTPVAYASYTWNNKNNDWKIADNIIYDQHTDLIAIGY